MQHNLGNNYRSYTRTARDEELALKNKRTGMTIFQISWIMAFISLVVVNWQLRFGETSWPPAGIEPLNPLLPTLVTVGLIVSVVLARRANTAISEDQQQRFRILWRGTLVLGAIFIAVMLFEWVNVPEVSTEMMVLANGIETEGVTNQYYAVFRLMTGFHIFHALVIGIYMLMVLHKANQGAYGSRDYWDVEAGMKLWYFVVVAWLMFYVVLYWV